MTKRVVLVFSLLALSALVALIASGSKKDSSPRNLACSYSSVEDLARQFLDALHEEDGQSILDLAVSREEFEQFVWPELPASRPGANLTAEFVWNQLNMRSQADIRGTFSRNKGKKWELLEVRFEEKVQEYPSFRIHKDAMLIVRDESGQKREMNLFGSIIELDGEFKIFSFVL